MQGNLGVLYAGWGCATSRALARGVLPYITRAIPRPILMAQLLEAFGALLSIFNR